MLTVVVVRMLMVVVMRMLTVMVMVMVMVVVVVVVVVGGLHGGGDTAEFMSIRWMEERTINTKNYIYIRMSCCSCQM
jgi:5-bromo-4-chloroindolyl phosphate hydrolysis protein